MAARWIAGLFALQGFEDLLVFEDCMNKHHDDFGKLNVTAKNAVG